MAVPRQTKTVTPIQNEKNVTFIYDLAPILENALFAQIRSAIADELGTTPEDTPPPDWFWRRDIEVPTRRGTLESETEFNQLVAMARALGVVGPSGLPPQDIPPGAILTSKAYIDDLSRAYAGNYATVKGLGEQTSGQVIDRIRRGMRAGKSPTEIAKDISERFNVSRSRAKTIADTNINAAYNDARLRAASRVEQQTGLIGGVIHISALLPTTRDEHAARHGKAYTPEDQAAWWDEGSNRINCHCTTRAVLVDSSGKIIEREAR